MANEVWTEISQVHNSVERNIVFNLISLIAEPNSLGLIKYNPGTSDT